MALIDKKVSEAYSGRDISSLSNRPNEDGIDGEELKARFDQLGKEVIPNFNDVIDILTDGQIEDIMIAFANGVRLAILGHYDTLIELQTEHPIGIIGDMWAIGTVKPYDIYVWNTDMNDWDNAGTLVPSNTSSDVTYDNTISELSATNVKTALDELASEKQDELVSGTNIKTINGSSVLGNGDLELLPQNNPTATGTQTLPNIVTNGIKFPATQVPSADPNTLDDYEEGTWTPVNASNNSQIGTWSTYTGKYVKIGKVVVATIEITGTGIGYSSTGGYTQITGLPFTVQGGFGGSWVSGNIGEGLCGITLGTVNSLWLLSPQVANKVSTIIWASVTYIAD